MMVRINEHGTWVDASLIASVYPWVMIGNKGEAWQVVFSFKHAPEEKVMACHASDEKDAIEKANALAHRINMGREGDNGECLSPRKSVEAIAEAWGLQPPKRDEPPANNPVVRPR